MATLHLGRGLLADEAPGHEVPAPAGAVSQHLRVLRDAEVLHERRDGTRRLYSIRPEAIDSVRAFLEELWPTSLTRLKRAVEDDLHRRHPQAPA